MDEHRTKCEKSREELTLMLEEAPPMYLSVIKMSITHGTVLARLHHGRNPLIGIAVQCIGVLHFHGQVLRCGPHHFQIVKDNSDPEQRFDRWKLQSRDESLRIVAREIWKVDGLT